MSKDLIFKKSVSDNDIQDVFNFNVQAFTNSQGFDWSINGIKQEIKDGWELYSVMSEGDIVAALFTKEDGDKFYTKNTPIKLTHQGNGFSHQIKEFYEKEAKKSKAKMLYNYCASDNFRMMALNERHDYQKTGKIMGDGIKIVEWRKDL